MRVDDDDDIQEYKKPWVGLPTIVILDVYAEILKEWRGGHQVNGQIAFAKAIEQALKERNTLKPNKKLKTKSWNSTGLLKPWARQ